MSRIDHHLHTSRHSPDSLIDPHELLVRAHAAGLDGVVITEHDYQWPDEELLELSQAAEGLVVLSGAEISAREGHFLVFGLPDLDEAPAGISVGDLVQVVRANDAAIVAAHPFRWDQDFRSIVEEHGAAFDALELISNNVSPQTRALTEELLAEYPMGTTGSSDAHEPEVVGRFYTEFSEPVRSMPDFVRLIRARAGRPGGASFEPSRGMR
jgi:predicted metal-dependent phosphoesterase TrpH